MYNIQLLIVLYKLQLFPFLAVPPINAKKALVHSQFVEYSDQKKMPQVESLAPQRLESQISNP